MMSKPPTAHVAMAPMFEVEDSTRSTVKSLAVFTSETSSTNGTDSETVPDVAQMVRFTVISSTSRFSIDDSGISSLMVTSLSAPTASKKFKSLEAIEEEK